MLKRKIDEEYCSNKKPNLNTENTNRFNFDEGYDFSSCLLKSSPNFKETPFIINGNIMEGKGIEYYEDGNIFGEASYKNGKKHGLCIEYYNINKLSSSDHLICLGVKRSTQLEHRIKNNIHDLIRKKTFYVDGLKHGKSIGYSGFGEIESEYNYVNGLEDGICKFHDFSETRKLGKLDGLCYREWRGIKIEERYYKNGKLHGIYIDRLENGTIILKCEYKDGKLDGKHEAYWDNGNIRNRMFYRDGKKNGTNTLYYKDGSFRSTREYKNNKPI